MTAFFLVVSTSILRPAHQERLFQLIIGFLRPRSIVAHTPAGTVRAGIGDIFDKTAVMTVHGLGIHEALKRYHSLDKCPLSRILGT